MAEPPVVAGARHLARRFFGAIRPGAPAGADEEWARSQLLAGERQVWDRMNNPDRRHAIGVARSVVHEFRSIDGRTLPPLERSITAAALLHDCGKVVSGLRTPARVAATLWWAMARAETADRWMDGPPEALRTRLGQYRRHPELGAELLEAAGSDPLTTAWAAEHHRPEQRWSVPLEVGRILKACDDD